MSQSVQPYAIIDDRLNVSDSIKFGVLKGAQSLNKQVFRAQAPTPSQSQITCIVPSLQTVIDREIYVRTLLEFTITGTVDDGDFLVNYPVNTCLAPFPFSQCVNTLQLQINNSSLSSDYQNTLDLILRQMNINALAKYNDLAPAQLDFYRDNATVGTLSPFKDITNCPDHAQMPRGSWAIESISGNTVGVTSNPPAADDHNKIVKIVVRTTEPCFISPLIYGDGVDYPSGLSGVSSLSFTYNMMSNANRALRIIPGTNTNITATLSAVNELEMLITFLTPKPSTMLPLTCSLPYMDLPIYKTVISGANSTGATFQVNSSVISPNTIPDKVIILVRDANPAVGQAEKYYPINNLNLVWGTNNGILSSASRQDLYRMSKRNGLNMTYQQFLGKGSNSFTGNTSTPILLTGGFVVLEYNTDINIQEEYFTSSSLGQFSFSVQVTCDNYETSAAQKELIVCFVNSGVFQSTAGSSSSWVGVISKQQCLSVGQEEPVMSSEFNRVVGGSWLSSIKSALPSVAKFVLPEAKKALAGMDNKTAQLGSKVLGAVGYGKPRVH